MNRPERLIAIFAVFGIVAAVAYWIYLFITEGSAPAPSEVWVGAKGLVQNVIGKLSFSDLSTYASNAGFSGDDLNTACAIALAESSGRPAAVGDLDITPGGSIGLWQINLKAHPEYTANELTDPQTNANAAFAVYQSAGNSFSPWSTYNSGAYQAFLPASTDSSNSDSTQADASVTDNGNAGSTVGGS